MQALDCSPEAPALPIGSTETKAEITYSYSITWKVREKEELFI